MIPLQITYRQEQPQLHPQGQPQSHSYIPVTPIDGSSKRKPRSVTVTSSCHSTTRTCSAFISQLRNYFSFNGVRTHPTWSRCQYGIKALKLADDHLVGFGSVDPHSFLLLLVHLELADFTKMYEGL